MHTIMLWSFGVFSTATRWSPTRLAKPSEPTALVASASSACLVGRIGPGLGDRHGAVVRPDPGLVGLDNGVERLRIDIALLGQDGLERAHPQLRLGEFRPVLVIMVVMMMVMIVVVIVSGHGIESALACCGIVHEADDPLSSAAYEVSRVTVNATKLFDLTGQVALVTGASSGLGVRFAEVLAAAGASVVLIARRADRLAAVKDRIEQAGGRAVAIAADVTDRAAMTRAFDAAETAFGTVTVLINNAGVVTSGRAVELTEEDWRRVIGTNLDAVFFWSQEAARRMLAAGKGGAIVNIASMLGIARRQGRRVLRGVEGGRDPAHQGAGGSSLRPRASASTPSRPAGSSPISTATISTASVAPRSSSEIPAGRFGDARDLDGALLLLASDAGRFITGATLVVDGGQLTALRG